MSFYVFTKKPLLIYHFVFRIIEQNGGKAPLTYKKFQAIIQVLVKIKYNKIIKNNK
jgi:hypothetical protein